MIGNRWTSALAVLLVGVFFAPFACTPHDDLGGVAIEESQPLDDIERSSRLFQQLDKLHIDGVLSEYRLATETDSRAYTKYRSYSHTWHHGFTLTYHRDCRVCDTNCRIYKALDVLYSRHPEWRTH